VSNPAEKRQVYFARLKNNADLVLRHPGITNFHKHRAAGRRQAGDFVIFNVTIRITQEKYGLRIYLVRIQDFSADISRVLIDFIDVLILVPLNVLVLHGNSDEATDVELPGHTQVVNLCFKYVRAFLAVERHQ
jgi:hypothetical protein